MKYSAQEIINSANSFLIGADRCFEQRPLGSNQFQMPIQPAIVCTAFAIELYFKAIITIEGSSAKGHDLSALFVQLSSTSQLAIRDQLSLSEIDLTTKLQTISGAFIEWRYVFEKPSANIDPSFLSDVARASKVVAESALNGSGSTS